MYIDYVNKAPLSLKCLLKKQICLGRDKAQGTGMSQPRAFCFPHLGLRNAGKCSPSPPSATAIRTWGLFCYFFVAVCWVSAWFKNVWQSLRDCWGYFHLLKNFSLCNSSCPWLRILAHQKTAFLLSFFHSVLDSFLYWERVKIWTI